MNSYYYRNLKTIDELLERDKTREEDGFPRKIRLGRIMRPGGGKKDKIIVVPTTVEEKFYHGEIPVLNKNNEDITAEEQTEETGGTGDAEEGEILGEEPVHQEGEGGTGAGEGGGEGHEVVSNAYDLGKILTEKFKLPNLLDKGKKKSFTKYSYDLTDKNRGVGQILDKKATLKKIVRTNQALGRIPDIGSIDSTNFIVGPRDKVYRTLSKEKDYESQAIVFFLRDYSASMYGRPTEIVTSQHLMIYSWLSYQYENQVESRFILHDTDAKEVPDFHTYYTLSIAGGTFVASAYKLVNKIIQEEDLARDFNIYVFHGTDGDDSDNQGSETLKEIESLLKNINRLGVSVVRGGYRRGSSSVESYLQNSGFLKSHKKFIHLSVIQEDADEGKVIDGIREMISEE
jgi:uncharacterized sporulation protein YeaH/YhbH (DUF444 family)